MELFQNQMNNEHLNKIKDIEKLITQLHNKLENQEKEYKKNYLYLKAFK